MEVVIKSASWGCGVSINTERIPRTGLAPPHTLAPVVITTIIFFEVGALKTHCGPPPCTGFLLPHHPPPLTGSGFEQQHAPELTACAGTAKGKRKRAIQEMRLERVQLLQAVCKILAIFLGNDVVTHFEKPEMLECELARKKLSSPWPEDLCPIPTPSTAKVSLQFSLCVKQRVYYIIHQFSYSSEGVLFKEEKERYLWNKVMEQVCQSYRMQYVP